MGTYLSSVFEMRAACLHREAVVLVSNFLNNPKREDTEVWVR